MEEFVQLFHYTPEALSSFPFLHHLMNDLELSSENYFIGPKTHDRICNHTKAIFQMLDNIVVEVCVSQIIITRLKCFYGNNFLIFLLLYFSYNLIIRVQISILVKWFSRKERDILDTDVMSRV